MALTYRQGVQNFWDWFPTVAEEFAVMLNDQRGSEVVPQVQAKLEAWMPSMCWVFGIEPDGHSFTVTGEGRIARQLLAEYWESQAVEVPGWQFFGSKQPSPAEQVAPSRPMLRRETIARCFAARSWFEAKPRPF